MISLFVEWCELTGRRVVSVSLVVEWCELAGRRVV